VTFSTQRLLPPETFKQKPGLTDMLNTKHQQPTDDIRKPDRKDSSVEDVDGTDTEDLETVDLDEDIDLDEEDEEDDEDTIERETI
jgi:hypothetical protein